MGGDTNKETMTFHPKGTKSSELVIPLQISLLIKRRDTSNKLSPPVYFDQSSHLLEDYEYLGVTDKEARLK